uniref:Uncharacterized protein n=1 Tax=Cannabis sativa TaxID=3483 RepID=A0A803NMX5_CANSA
MVLIGRSSSIEPPFPMATNSNVQAPANLGLNNPNARLPNQNNSTVGTRVEGNTQNDEDPPMLARSTSQNSIRRPKTDSVFQRMGPRLGNDLWDDLNQRRGNQDGHSVS